MQKIDKPKKEYWMLTQCGFWGGQLGYVFGHFTFRGQSLQHVAIVKGTEVVYHGYGFPVSIAPRGDDGNEFILEYCKEISKNTF